MKPLPPALARTLAAAQWPQARAHVLTAGFIPWRNLRRPPQPLSTRARPISMAAVAPQIRWVSCGQTQ
jgi:hypothetical protein